MHEIKEKTYKIVSVSAATLDTIGKPVVKYSHKLMLEGSNDLETSIDTFLDTFQESWYSPSKLVPYLKKANSAFHKLTRSGISKSYEDHMSLVHGLETYLTSEQQSLEAYLANTGSQVHHEWVFSNQNRQTLQELLKIVKTVTKDLKKMKYSKIWKYCMTFVCMQKAARDLIWTPKFEEIDEKVLEGLRMLKYFSRYAVAIYGKYLVSIIIQKRWTDLLFSDSEELIFCKYLGIPECQLVYSHMKSRKNIPSHSVSIDNTIRSIIVTVRGTNSIFDCMTDLKSSYESFTFTDPVTKSTILGSVHSGIMHSAQELSQEIKSVVLSCLQEWSNYSLTLVGHSLGAGISTCLTLLWLSDPLFESKSISAFTYGPVQVLSSSLNQVLKDKIFSIVYGNDIVSRLSLGSVQDLSNAIQEIHSMEANGELDVDELTNNWFFKENFEYRNVMEGYLRVKEKMREEGLELSGKVLQVYSKKKHSDHFLLPVDGDEFRYGVVDPGFYSEIILDKNSFWDHMPDTYEEVIVGLPLDTSTIISKNH